MDKERDFWIKKKKKKVEKEIRLKETPLHEHIEDKAVVESPCPIHLPSVRFSTIHPNCQTTHPNISRFYGNYY